MKVIILQEQTKLIESDWPIPIPKAHEILIQIKASGFNPIDYQMLENELERKLIKSPILGRELSGIVVKVGEMVSEFKIGDEVYSAIGSMGSNGSYAEYVCAPAAVVALKPQNLSFEAAAAVPSVGTTALQIFNRLRNNWTKSVLITGASGAVGSFLIQILRAHGYTKTIFATYGSTVGFDKLVKLGIEEDHLIDYTLKNWDSSNPNLQNIDMVIDLVGNKFSEISAQLLKTNGIYGNVTAFVTPSAYEILFNKGAVIINISNFAYAFAKDYEYYQSSLRQLTRWFEQGLLVESAFEIVGNLSLNTVQRAHEQLKYKQTKAKKLVMKHI